MYLGYSKEITFFVPFRHSRTLDTFIFTTLGMLTERENIKLDVRSAFLIATSRLVLSIREKTPAMDSFWQSRIYIALHLQHFPVQNEERMSTGGCIGRRAE